MLHGIGAKKQLDGIDPLLALQSFNQYIGSSPLLAFHAAFDEAMIQRYQHKYLNAELPNVWLDIDHLCAVTYEKVRARALDDWMLHFRHLVVLHDIRQRPIRLQLANYFSVYGQRYRLNAANGGMLRN